MPTSALASVIEFNAESPNDLNSISSISAGLVRAFPEPSTFELIMVGGNGTIITFTDKGDNTQSPSPILKKPTGSAIRFCFEDNGVVLLAAQTKPDTKFFVQPSLQNAGAIQFAVPQSVKRTVAFRDEFENPA